MTSPEIYLAHIQKTFAMVQIPTNVRAGRQLGRLPLLRRFSHRAIGFGWLPAEGCFFYRNRDEEKRVNFNGRNLQFHALYDPGYARGYELESAVLIMTLCKGKDAFFDIGSNWGYFSLLMASAQEFAGPIYAFEPNPRTFADLLSVIQQSGIGARVTALNHGVGEKVCQMALEEPDSFKTGLARLSNSGEGMKISVMPLDELNLPVPGMLKIDAEGMESEVLRGTARILAVARPFVLFENFSNPLNPELTCKPFEILQSKGYGLYAPALLFREANYFVPATYGADFNELLDLDPQPQLGLFEVTIQNRFFLPQQLNILAVHSARVHELWEAGIVNLAKTAFP
jgi:FkbM family methyltransferase